ncbi:hypothetical protein AT15_08025 [Kosmotoga arenicorallina S304]|uniref:inorganic diphosphatase n=1 Tax=Kosmotoga arenicorallina S304 TaxID=1453497 RepID=A0A182C7E3_9BACT|nr:putative manganese-dependent inorganic diphosphatase [Kosmotoga arenicorallina]OAA31434.1 hypothetical protein AT15_08025 [Kosmotoga arenicorallina S304]
MSREKIYVFGHRQPDTDSIASVIGYAYMKNQNDKERDYVACRCGKLNSESTFLLSYFDVEPPIFMETVDPIVGDLDLRPPIVASEETSTYEVAKIMEEHNIKVVPIVDENFIPSGIVSERHLARTYVKRLSVDSLELHPINVNTIAQLLSGDVLVSPPTNILKGKVHIASDSISTFIKKLKSTDLVIVGDNPEMQIKLIERNVTLMILTDSLTPSDEVLKLAKRNNVGVISTAYGPYGVGKLINLSMPVKMIMSKNFITAKLDEKLKEIKTKIYESNERFALALDESGKLAGVITRTNLLYDTRKKVILLDHNERPQAVDGLEEAELLEVIDHHRLGGLTTLKPVRFHNEPVGSTSTIVGEWFLRHCTKKNPQIAGVLLGGIVSDTLDFRLSTTTKKDREIARQLAEIAEIDLEEFAKNLLRKGLDLSGKAPYEVVSKDVKQYIIGDYNILIAQVMVMDMEQVKKRQSEFKDALKELYNRSKADVAFLLFTNVPKNQSEVWVEGNGEIIEKAFKVHLDENNTVVLKGVMSRKKDFLPQIGEVLRKKR